MKFTWTMVISTLYLCINKYYSNVIVSYAILNSIHHQPNNGTFFIPKNFKAFGLK